MWIWTIYISFTYFAMTKCSANNKMEPFIVGGNYSKIKNHPHSVFLYVQCNGNWICGGSIINQKIILTAAHCLYGCTDIGKINAYAGHENKQMMQVRKEVSKIILHEQYHDTLIYNDIGLAFLRDSFPFGETIKRVALTDTNYQYIGSTSIVAGWGLINDITREGSVILKSAPQTVLPVYVCGQYGQMLPGMLCAGGVDRDQPRPSEGDSGSALVVKGFKQIGIVSFRFPLMPSLVIYSNVSYYYPWIIEKTRLLNCG